MLTEIGSIDNVPAFIDDVKAGKGRLQGFGHRVYKNYDPRATIIKKTAYEVFEVTGKNPLLDIALKLEEVALTDDYFISRKLYPNVDFYSGLIYQAMGFPIEMFTVLFAIPRTSGWLAHWNELLDAGPEDRPAPPAVHRRRRARLRRHRRARLARSATTTVRGRPWGCPTMSPGWTPPTRPSWSGAATCRRPSWSTPPSSASSN